MESHGISWNLMEPYGKLWKVMESYGKLWNSVEHSRSVLAVHLHSVDKQTSVRATLVPSSKQSSAQRLSTVVGARTRLLKQAARIASYLRPND